MKLLLDTHLLLWAAAMPEKLSRQARTLINTEENHLYFSAASMWEVVTKSQLGRRDFEVDARVLRRGLLDNGYHELNITSEHAVRLESLPVLHKDPFDRMLVAQAITEGLILLTSDKQLTRYKSPVKKV